jgi:glycosyltransferase involved in cell wall biosynthesis
MPFSLAHGGGAIQIQQTMAALQAIGIDVRPLHWWEPHQPGDILHVFGRVHGQYASLAKGKGLTFVFSDLLTQQGSRTWLQRIPHFFLRQVDRATRGRIIAAQFGWTTYRMADAVIALTPWERILMIEMFGPRPDRIHVVPNGVEEVFLKAESGKLKAERGEWLVCTATVTERKRVLELAEAATVARTPVWIIGKPYSESDPYYRRFQQVVGSSGGVVRYEGGISDRARMAEIYQSARGFVLLSTMESLSLSALEAAAAGCPLLLSDLPWARCTFEQRASYCPIASPVATASLLKAFYDDAPGRPLPDRPATWREVAVQLKGIYEGLLASR